VFCPNESPTLGVVIWFSHGDFCSNDRTGESIELELKNGGNSKQQSSNNHNNGGAKTGAKTGGYRSQVTMLALIQIDHSQKRANDVDQEEQIPRQLIMMLMKNNK